MFNVDIQFQTYSIDNSYQETIYLPTKIIANLISSSVIIIISSRCSIYRCIRNNSKKKIWGLFLRNISIPHFLKSFGRPSISKLTHNHLVEFSMFKKKNNLHSISETVDSSFVSIIWRILIIYVSALFQNFGKLGWNVFLK